jgi:16S rRNA (guanine(966)-N(2))-methyltransferase RsmD
VRIVAGALKGRRLVAPAGRHVRPTTDGLRETLFNVLQDRVREARVLDGYAGTGAIGLEALSRGAATVTFIERDRAALTALDKNVAACRVQSACAIIRVDFLRGAAALAQSRTEFDLVVIDPPYEDPDLGRAVEVAAMLIDPTGLLVVEHARRRALAPAAGALKRVRQVTAGDSSLTFYER